MSGNTFLLITILLSAEAAGQEAFYLNLSAAALELTKEKVKYDPGYYTMDYPDGDVPPGRGVCTDVIIRAYRMLGIDLQKEVHDDMKAHFSKYPANWGLTRTDTNIDHRRVPNLMTFFSRQGQVKKLSSNPADYMPGDIVTWDLGRGIPHIGIVTDIKSSDSERPLIVHNIGNGQEISDCLFSYTITGHYRYSR